MCASVHDVVDEDKDVSWWLFTGWLDCDVLWGMGAVVPDVDEDENELWCLCTGWLDCLCREKT